MKKNETTNPIPFVKPAEVGHFLISRRTKSLGKMKGGVEQIVITDKEGLWQVCVPQTYEMYGILTSLFRDFRSDDADKSKQAKDVMFTYFTNMMWATSLGNGFYQRGLLLLAQLYTTPEIGDEKAFLDELNHLKEDFKQWKKGYDAAMHVPTPEEMKSDEIGEEMLAELTKKEGE